MRPLRPSRLPDCAGRSFRIRRTPLQVWFYAIYLFVTTRHGVSGKELERALGVTYKTAWRMGQQIRTLMAKADGFETMKGHVEIDEAYVGGYRPHGGPGKGDNKTIVLGIVERGGRTVAKSVPNLKAETVRPFVYKNIEAGAAVSTDESPIYDLLKSAGLRPQGGQSFQKRMAEVQLPPRRISSYE